MNEPVERKPDVQFGRPVIRGTGIPVEVVADRFGAGESYEELAEDYGLTIRQVKDALRWWGKHFDAPEDGKCEACGINQWNASVGGWHLCFQCIATFVADTDATPEAFEWWISKEQGNE